MRRSFVLALMMTLAVAMLSGCAGETTPTPTPDPVATQVAVEKAAAATLTAEAPTQTPTPTATSTPTPTPTPTPTATPTQTPTPTPTVLPHEQLDEGSRQRANGNYVQAVRAFWDLLSGDPSPDQSREARYRFAEAYQLDGEYLAAALAWEEFIGLYPDDSRRPQAELMAGRAYQAAGQCDAAIAHYQAYMDLEVLLADRVGEWIADCLTSQGELEDAVRSYGQALAVANQTGDQQRLREKIAGAYLKLENYDGAVAEYDALLGLALTDEQRARMEYLAGQALAAGGQVQAAFERYQSAADRYPEAEYAYFSLVELVYGGAEVDEYQRGLIDYYAGAKYPDAYGASVRAFDRFLAAAPGERTAQALYYKALGQRAVGQAVDALETLQQVIDEYPRSELVEEAHVAKAVSLAQAGDSDGAVEAYTQIASQFPESDAAPDALWSAARLRQSEDLHAEAASLYQELSSTFPAYEDVDAVLWYAGLEYYRAGDLAGAEGTWQALLDGHPDSVYAPKTLYWLGKIDAKPEQPEFAGYWEQLLTELPNHYYALRVQQIQAGESLTATRLITAAVESPPWDGELFDAEVLPWLAGWTDVPTGTVAIGLPSNVTNSVDLARAEMLLEVGLRGEALAVFERIQDSVGDDPLALAGLAGYYRERGLYGLAASSAARLADLSPEEEIQAAPLALQRVAYPLAYADLLSTEARNQNLDPLLLAALVRQESLFEPAAESWVGARGLGQVMPGTGQEIADALGIEDFDVDDLYRPSTSIRFGAHYLASQLAYFDDEILVALAAYNGGPGNALAWLEAGGYDLDLFIEVITAVQSRLYLQGVYQQYVDYERLYRQEG